MQIFQYSILVFLLSSLRLVNSSINQDGVRASHHQLSPKMLSDITVHGVLFWASVGFFMPLGILIIRLADRERNRTRAKILFYIHAILQVLSGLLASAGAVTSLRNLENSFDNSHQRIGLFLYAAIWVQALIGFFRPRRGSRRRTAWYIGHWILGTIISLVGIFNIYTGLEAFNKKTSKSVKLWTILFTAEVFFIAFFYLFQDKWHHLQKQEQISDDQPTTTPSQVNAQNQNQKVLVPESCSKRNALKNLFD